MSAIRKRITLLLKIVISAAIIGVLVYQTASDPHIWELLGKPKRWEWFVMAAVAQTAGTLISQLRWWLLANAVGVRLSPWNSIRIGFISYAFHLIAFGVAGGDLLRSFYVCREDPERKPHAVSSVILDRGVGLMTMFICVAAASMFIDWDSLLVSNPNKDDEGLSQWLVLISRVSIGVTIAGILGVLSVAIFGRGSWQEGIRTATGKLPAGKIITSLVDVVLLYRSRPVAVFMSFIMSLGVVSSLVLCAYCLAQGLTSLTPTFGQHFIITPLSLIAGAVPLPMGIGSQELAMKLLYKWFSTATVDADYGLLVAFGYRMITFMLMSVGVVLYFWQGKKKRDQMDAAMEQSEKVQAG